MISNPKRSRTWIAALAALALSAALVFHGTGIQPHSWAIWFAPLPVLLVAPRLRWWTAGCLAALSWLLGSLNAWRYLRNILVIPDTSHRGPALAMPIAMAIFVLAVPALFFATTMLLSRHFARRGALWRAALVFPAGWVSYEYLSEIGSPHSTFGNLAYSQMDFLPLLQLASLTGVWGISFCVFLFSGTVATLCGGAGGGKRKRALAAGVAAFFAALMIFGWWRLRSSPGVEHTVTVGLAASDLPRNLILQEGPAASRLFRDYADVAAALARQGAQVIVLPEKLGVTVDPDTRNIDLLFQAVADKSNVDVVVGILRVAPPLKFNEARIYSPSCTTVLSYDKHHMLPAFESALRPGTTRTLLQKQSGLWGVAICKDMDFPKLSRGYGAAGAGLLLVPAWDFVDDAWLHDRMAVMRGVESGFSIARASKEGLLTVSDNRGRVLAEQSSAAPFATLIASAPVRHDDTPYTRFGDWFAWLNLASVAMILVSLGFKRTTTGS